MDTNGTKNHVNLAAASVRRSKQKGVFIAGILSLSPQFPSP